MGVPRGAVGNKLCNGLGYSLVHLYLQHILYSVMKVGGGLGIFPENVFKKKCLKWFIFMHCGEATITEYKCTAILTI